MVLIISRRKRFSNSSGYCNINLTDYPNLKMNSLVDHSLKNLESLPSPMSIPFLCPCPYSLCRRHCGKNRLSVRTKHLYSARRYCELKCFLKEKMRCSVWSKSFADIYSNLNFGEFSPYFFHNSLHFWVNRYFYKMTYFLTTLTELFPPSNHSVRKR